MGVLLEERVSKLETDVKDIKDSIKDLSYYVLENAKSINKLQNVVYELALEFKEFKDEMKDFKTNTENIIADMRKQWGELAIKMGTLVEDIFIPSFDISIEKYFKCLPDIVMPRKKVRKYGTIQEADILALCTKNKYAFLVEVKASPDRTSNITQFIKKIKVAPKYFPEIKGNKLIPIYAGLNMNEVTIKTLTNKKIFAMVLKGDILVIENFEDLKGDSYDR